MNTPSANMVEKAAALATTKSNKSTAAPVAATSLNKSITKQSTPPVVNNMDSKMQSAASSVPNTPTQEMCASIIKEADSLVTALEDIGAMFGIPKENIICDDTLDDIKVQGDTIIAPSVPTEGRGNAIMRSISAVLDYISQRIDAKLNKYQGDNIEKGIILDRIENDANPAKGKVIGRRVTDEGDEILIYDSGLVDMPNTDSARALVTQLRASGAIPTPVTPEPTTGIQYFTDEDQIDRDLNIPTQGGSNLNDSGAGPRVDNPNDDFGIPSQTPVGQENDMSTNVNESYSMLSLVSKYGNTTHLGYDMMTEMGIKGIQPVDFLLESGDNKKAILPSEIKHMKFDNTHIMKAVKLFNSVRAEQRDVRGKDINIAKMVNSPNWHKAIQELEKQFDCHLVVHYLKDSDNPHDTDAMTSTVAQGYEYRQNVSVSKSKGFQLNGLPITIYLLNNVLIENAPTDPSLFGQAVVAILLHEIFHNVMMVFREYNTEFNSMLTTTMIAASLTKNAKVRRKLITNFANAVDAMNPPGEKMNIVQKKIYIKKLLLTCSLREGQESMKLAQELVENDDFNLDEYIKAAEKFQHRQEKKITGHGLEIKSLIGLGVGFSLLCGGLAAPTFALTVIGGGLMAGSYGAYKLGGLIRGSMRKDYESRKNGDIKNYEEHWADMFATMYNLPVTMFNVPKTHLVAARMTDDQIKRLHQIEMNWVTLMDDEHPPTTERLAASVKYARQTLDSGIKLNPDVKKYLEWIIANHSRILDVEDIDTIYSKATFDPKTAEDIDLHIGNLISKTNTNITEQSS